jgi:hypothetical protein
MGAKTWMLAYVEGDAAQILKQSLELNRDATSALVAKLFPKDKVQPLDDGDLTSASPPDSEIVIGCFPGVEIVAAKEFAIDYPSKLDNRFLEAAAGRTVYLHAMHSVVDWFAYAVWKNGKLERSLSLSPDSGIIEDIGTRREFEESFWNGSHPVGDPEDGGDSYPLPFHPLELGEAALFNLFGYQLEGMIDENQVQPESIPLMRFKRSRSLWKFW